MNKSTEPMSVRDSTPLCRVDWLSSGNSFKSQSMIPETVESTYFKQALYPASVEYVYPFPTLFLSQWIHPRLLNQYPIWIVRDGLVPLVWFFKNHPNPKGIKSRILVHQSFASFVPKAWEPCVGTYEVISNQLQEKGDKFLLTGLMTDLYCNIQALEEILLKAREKLGSRSLKIKKKLSYLNGMPGMGGEWVSSMYASRYMITLCDSFGSNISLAQDSYLYSYESLRDYLVIDLNDRLHLADSYLIHKPLSQGATLFQVESNLSPSQDEKYIPLSPFHGIRVRERVQTQKLNSASFIKKIESLRLVVLAKNINSKTPLPWLTWLMQSEGSKDFQPFRKK